jgi:hypothetical protein
MVRRQTNAKAGTGRGSRKAATKSNRTAKVTKAEGATVRAKTSFGRRSAGSRSASASGPAPSGLFGQSGLFGMWRWFNPFWFAMWPGR